MPNDKQQTSFAFLQKPLFALILIPATFIFLWSNGYIGAKLVLPHASPWTVLSIRFIIVAIIMTILALVLKSPWPTKKEQFFHIAVIGILLQAFYLGGAFMGMDSGIDAATSALIGALPPLFTAIAAFILIRERLTFMGWSGIAIGMLGVFMVVTLRLDLGFGSFGGFIANFLGAVALALAAAYQKKYMVNFNWVTASVIQFVAAACVSLLFAFMFEDMSVEWTPQLFAGLAILVFALSIGAVTLLQLLIKQGAATGVMSLLFLVPVSTALIAWPLFGETFSPLALIGFALAVLGVRLVQKGVVK